MTPVWIAAAWELPQWIAVATLLGATTLFITRLIPLPMTALAVPVVLSVTGVIDATKALSGFGNSAVIAIGAVMVIGGGLKESGVATLMARGLQRIGGTGELGLVVLLMFATSLLAAVMNNTAVVAILLPVVSVLARRADVAPSRLMMPMAFAAVLGGTISMIGTAPNLIASNEYNKTAAVTDQIGVFDFAMVGIPITLTGIVFMALVGRRLLPIVRTADRLKAARLPSDVAESYGIRKKLFKMRVIAQSGVAGKTIAEADIGKRFGLAIIMIRRPAALGERWLQPEPDLVLQDADSLYVQGQDEGAWEFAETELVQFGLPGPRAVSRLLDRGAVIAEVTVSPHSAALGKTLKDLDFRKLTGLNVLALWRRDAPVHDGLAEVALELGDAFLVSGSAEHVQKLSGNPDFIVLTDHSQLEDVTRAPLAIALLLLALLPPVIAGFPLAVSALGAAILMVGTGCIGRSSVVRTIDWKVLAILVGTLPLGIALLDTGISTEVAAWFEPVAAWGGLPAVFALLFFLAAVMSVLISNAAAAAIMAPVAIEAAGLVDLDPRKALLAMAYGCSCNFLLPFAQCNLIVMAPGGYGTRDYVRVGIWQSLVMAATAIGVLSIL